MEQTAVFQSGIRRPDIEVIAARLARYYATAIRGDHTLNPDLAIRPDLRDAAVLIPLSLRDGIPHIVFTQRAAHLNTHPGQVSFPGGRVEKNDQDAAETALREASEEIGLDPQNVRILGTLDHYITRTGFRVRPVVGLIRAPQVYVPDDFEVETIFDVPLDFLQTPGTITCRTVENEGILRRYYTCQWRRHQIWGATAGMLKNFIDVIGENSAIMDTDAA